MMRRLAALTGATLLIALGAFAPAAHAATYPPAVNVIQLSLPAASEIDLNTPYDLEISPLLAGSTVRIKVVSLSEGLGEVGGDSFGTSRGAAVLAPAATTIACSTGQTCNGTADEDGIATGTVTFTKAGSTEITVTGTNADGEAIDQSVTVEVPTADTAANETAPGGLAKTGSDLIEYGLIGVGLVVVGGIVVVAMRRRSPGSVA